MSLQNYVLVGLLFVNRLFKISLAHFRTNQVLNFAKKSLYSLINDGLPTKYCYETLEITHYFFKNIAMMYDLTILSDKHIHGS